MKAEKGRRDNRLRSECATCRRTKNVGPFPWEISVDKLTSTMLIPKKNVRTALLGREIGRGDAAPLANVYDWGLMGGGGGY